MSGTRNLTEAPDAKPPVCTWSKRSTVRERHTSVLNSRKNSTLQVARAEIWRAEQKHRPWEVKNERTPTLEPHSQGANEPFPKCCGV